MDADELLAAIQSDAHLTVEMVVEVLAKRWPRGVVVMALEADASLGKSLLSFSYRGCGFATMGMLEDSKALMLRELLGL